jgi:DNA/RNA endonuclease G (NUC1)
MGKIWRKQKRRKKARARGLGATHVVNPLVFLKKIVGDASLVLPKSRLPLVAEKSRCNVPNKKSSFPIMFNQKRKHPKNVAKHINGLKQQQTKCLKTHNYPITKCICGLICTIYGKFNDKKTHLK